jgi:FAD/FMN-containing dehydrogenase
MSSLVERALQRLGQRLDGRLSTTGDPRYAAAIAIWPKVVGLRPRAVAHCRSAEDVQAAIRAARDCDLRLSVRGGGHDWAARSLCDGLVVDLGAMNGVVIGPDDIAATDGGARAAHVAAQADPLGLAAVTGSVASVGLAGLTLGGGYGPLIGRFGLALDNLIGAEVVLADGQIALATSSHERELFWALRGGGGNFGVVTTLWHRLHHVPSVRSGLLVYPFEQASAVWRGAAEIAASAPDELTVQLGLLTGADGRPVAMVVPAWCGPPGEGEARLAPVLKLGNLIAGGLEAMPYGTMLRLFDPYLSNGLRVFADSCWLPALDGDSIDLAIGAIGKAGPGCAVLTHEFRGAAARVPEAATAFGLRRDHVMIEVLAAFAHRSDPREEMQHRQWTRTTRDAFGAKALPGAYPHFLAPDDHTRARQSYGRNGARLLAAKRRYDPDNLFRSAIPLPT